VAEINTQAQALAGLKDLHLPPAIAWWPPAPGWFILLGLILLIGLIYAIYKYRRWRRLYFQRQALLQLSELKEQYLNQVENSLERVSILLRRLSLYCYPRLQVAGLVGEAWLKFLDETGRTDQFSQGIGQHLLTAPYQALCAEDVITLFDLVEQWIKMADRAKKLC
jgi:hypothetical protein